MAEEVVEEEFHLSESQVNGIKNDLNHKLN